MQAPISRRERGPRFARFERLRQRMDLRVRQGRIPHADVVDVADAVCAKYSAAATAFELAIEEAYLFPALGAFAAHGFIQSSYFFSSK